MNPKYIAPGFEQQAFNCPFCGAFSAQIWDTFYTEVPRYTEPPSFESTIYIARCNSCADFSIWLNGIMVYPDSSIAPLPHDDMPENVKELYNEARGIINKSPRGASALLRLALDKLCNEVCEDCKSSKLDGKLDLKIGILVSKGLPGKLQKVFDFVRVTGNDAVHELGLMNVKDNPEIAVALFSLINIIVEKMITEDKKIDGLYELIPEKRREKIEERNAKVLNK